MGAIASQITSLTIVYSTVYSSADQRKRQSSASLAFVRGIHRGPVNSPHKWPVTRKMFPFDDVIMLQVPDQFHQSTQQAHFAEPLPLAKQHFCDNYRYRSQNDNVVPHTVPQTVNDHPLPTPTHSHPHPHAEPHTHTRTHTPILIILK